MSNSALAKYHLWTNKHSGARTEKISKIAIHHMAGNLSRSAMESIIKSDRQMSCTYAIYTDGTIEQFVDEAYRSWCTSSNWCDQRAISIEVANDSGEPNWHVSDKAMASLIDLCTDICKRNGIKTVTYTGDKNGTLVKHQWFAATGCPGPYLGGKFEYIRDQVNARLKEPAKKAEAKPKTTPKKDKNGLEIVNSCKGLSVRFINNVWRARKDSTGNVVNYTGVAPNDAGWWFLKDGIVDFKKNGVEHNDNGWWAIFDGKVNFNFTGWRNNAAGRWYCVNGKVDFDRTIKEAAKLVWQGKFGNGTARTKNMKAAGFSAEQIKDIQKAVNKGVK